MPCIHIYFGQTDIQYGSNHSNDNQVMKKSIETNYEQTAWEEKNAKKNDRKREITTDKSARKKKYASTTAAKTKLCRNVE